MAVYPHGPFCASVAIAEVHIKSLTWYEMCIMDYLHRAFRLLMAFLCLFALDVENYICYISCLVYLTFHLNFLFHLISSRLG